MNPSLVDSIVNAVLYEGYILYPYRPTSKKNRRRFSFGRVYPRAYSEAQEGAEPCMMQTECLLRGSGGSAAIHVKLRFLHVLAREIGKFHQPVPEPSFDADIPGCEWVPELHAGGKLYQPWQEAIEHDVDAGLLPVEQLMAGPFTTLFSQPANSTREWITDNAGLASGVVVRKQQAIEGSLWIAATPLDCDACKITVRILNLTPVAENLLDNQDAVVMRTFASTHTILNAVGGEFISLTDPPPEYAVTATACKNIGTWPVLVGDGKKRERDTLLSSPIILPDYPQIAPESPGDLHDGTEIDEILSLRIMTMTDAEKLEMRNVDDHARRILERTENLRGEDFMKMHGMMRDVQTFGEEFFNPASPLKKACVAGVELAAGDRVRIRPKGRADAMDMALAGRIGLIEAVEQDAEGQVHFALVLEDDPGRDLGMLRQPGHRFFYRMDEVEPVEAAKP